MPAGGILGEALDATCLCLALFTRAFPSLTSGPYAPKEGPVHAL